jgi:hypothetical protein
MRDVMEIRKDQLVTIYIVAIAMATAFVWMVCNV